MYVHVPAAWTAYLAFVVVLVASVAYLVRRNLVWDRRARAAAEVGVGMTGLAIALGSIWGRPVWGVWWTWDPRLVTTTVLLLIYVGYLGVRGLSSDADLNARRAAVVGVVGFVNVPVVHFSVVWWRALHQPPTVLRPGGPAAIDAVMLVALLLALVAFTLGSAWLFLCRVRVLALREVGPVGVIGVVSGDRVLVPAVTVVSRRML
jgi:heme exporter protein C